MYPGGQEEEEVWVVGQDILELWPFLSFRELTLLAWTWGGQETPKAI